MRILGLAALLFAISASQEPEKPNFSPSDDQVQRLESKLSNEQCIGDLSQWEKRYQLWTDVRQGSPTNGTVYPKIIAFRFRKGTTHYLIQPARQLLPATPSLSFQIDDRPGYSAGGRFDTASGKLTLQYCGYSEGG